MADSGQRPSVLLITRNFPPLTGGMERLMQHAAQGIAEWAELDIIGPRGCAAAAPAGCEVREVPASLGGFVTRGALAAWSACARRRYDLVIGGSGLAAPILRLLQVRYGVTTAVFVHGLDLVVDNAAYQHLFVPCLRRADLVIANSRNTMALARERGVAQDRLCVVNPGTDIPDLSQLAGRDDFCARHDIPFQQILLFAGRLTRRKGLSRFIEHCLAPIVAAKPQAGLVVVGDNPGDSLNKLGEMGLVLERVAALSLADKVRFLGQVSDAELLAAFAAADLQVFPLLDVPGDVEGFGMVAIEAAACGTPTIAFRSGGVADAIGEGSGKLVTADDYAGLTRTILEQLDAGADHWADSCRAHAEKFGWPHFHQHLHLALGKVLQPRTSGA